ASRHPSGARSRGRRAGSAAGRSERPGPLVQRDLRGAAAPRLERTAQRPQRFTQSHHPGQRSLAQAPELTTARRGLPAALQTDRGARHAAGPGRGRPEAEGAKTWRWTGHRHLRRRRREPPSGADQLLGHEAALEALARLEPRQARVVESRFFGGFDVAESAELLGVSEATVLRDWRAAKAWLARELRRAS